MQSAFLAIERGLQAIAPRGSRKCRKIMRKMDEALSCALPHPAVALRNLDDEARAMLRLRCAVCTKKCKEPLSALTTQAPPGQDRQPVSP